MYLTKSQKYLNLKLLLNSPEQEMCFPMMLDTSETGACTERFIYSWTWLSDTSGLNSTEIKNEESQLVFIPLFIVRLKMWLRVSGIKGIQKG